MTALGESWRSLDEVANEVSELPLDPPLIPTINSPLHQTENSHLLRVMRVFTNGVSDERIRNAAVTVASKMTVNEKLTKIDALLRIPPTASAEELGKMFGVTGQAVFKTGWWTLNRKGENESEIGRRQSKHKKRAEDYEPPSHETG